MKLNENLQTTDQQHSVKNEAKKKGRGFSLKKLRYRNMNIMGRLMTAFASILLFSLLISGVGFISLDQIQGDVETLNQVDLVLMKKLDNVNYLISRKLAAVRGYLLTENDRYLTIIEENTATQNEEMALVLERDSSQEVKDVMDEIYLLDTYAQTEIIDLMQEGFADEALANAREVYNPRIEQSMDDVLELSLSQTTNARNVLISIIDNIDSTRVLVAILGIVATISALVVSILSARSFRRPIVNVVRKLHAFGSGQLNIEPFHADGDTEIDQLLEATDEVQRNLTRIIGNIRQATVELARDSDELSQSSNEVRSGSEQVAITMQELSTGTESQAHAASDLASNMEAFGIEFVNASQSSEEITSASEGVLHLSGQGVELMNSSSEQMTKINEIVNSVVGKMTKLEQDTQEITKLVEIVHGIADQTNLLALNAAIEAARAGEHGRGFSIVADEVRKLSEQVAESVKEITGFVENIQIDSKDVTDSLKIGEEEASAGLESLNETSETFDQIFNAIDRVARNITAINDTLGSLAKTNEEMNDSVTEVASVSEESAAGVEETSAAAQEINSTMDEVASNAANLAELSERLNNEVAEYTLNDGNEEYIDFDLI